MVVKIHFETLSPGLKAKLDAKYRASKNHVHADYTNGTLRKLYRNGSSANALADDVRLSHNRT